MPFEKNGKGFGISPETPSFIPDKEPLPEQSVEKETPNSSERAESPMSSSGTVPVPFAAPVAKKSPRLEHIENILGEDLTDVYRAMPVKSQMAFKARGEETATKIEKLLKAAKVNVRKIVALIHKWLKLIPGVNRYFLEQESKIKADKILKLK